MKKILAILLTALLALSIVPAMAEDYTIGALLSDTSNTFFVTMADAIKAKGDELGVKTIILDGANDSAKDVTNMEDLISAKVDIVLYNPVDSDAAAAVVEMAAKAGIPVISIDRSVNGAEVISHIASDNVYGGRIARSVAKMEKDEQTGMTPERAAKTIVKTALGRSRSPARCIGFSYKLISLLVRLLPRRTAQVLVAKLYAK